MKQARVNVSRRKIITLSNLINPWFNFWVQFVSLQISRLDSTKMNSGSGWGQALLSNLSSGMGQETWINTHSYEIL